MQTFLKAFRSTNTVHSSTNRLLYSKAWRFGTNGLWNTLKNNKAPDKDDLAAKMLKSRGEINSEVCKLVKEV